MRELEIDRAQWDEAIMLLTDLSDDRANLEETPAPAFPCISVDGRRIVNTAVIAYAQQLVASLSQGGLAMLAKETMSKRLYDVRYGSRDECARLMALLREALSPKDENENLAGLKERTDALRANASYRSDADSVPLTDSIGTLPIPALPVSGTGNRESRRRQRPHPRLLGPLPGADAVSRRFTRRPTRAPRASAAEK